MGKLELSKCVTFKRAGYDLQILNCKKMPKPNFSAILDWLKLVDGLVRLAIMIEYYCYDNYADEILMQVPRVIYNTPSFIVRSTCYAQPVEKIFSQNIILFLSVWQHITYPNSTLVKIKLGSLDFAFRPGPS